MLRKKIITIIGITMISIMTISGVNAFTNIVKPIEVQAQTFGTQTPTGVISGKITYEDNIPDNPTIEQLKAMSVSINPIDNPELFWIDPLTNRVSLNSADMYLTDKIYHWGRYDEKWGQQVDHFIKVLKLEKGDKQGYVSQTTTTASFVDGVVSVDRSSVYTGQNYKAYNAIVAEETTALPIPPVVKPPVEDVNKVINRFAGIDRYLTAKTIAEGINKGKLNSVVLAYGLAFPDALSGSVLASKVGAPILLTSTGVENSKVTLDYIKQNLAKDGKIYLLGGESVIKPEIVNNLKDSGYSNIVRLGGADRYSTNSIINKEINAPKGNPVVVATASNFADALSVSGFAGAKQMPIYLVGSTISAETVNEIKAMNPSAIYIAGGTTAVTAGVESTLRDITGNITRFNGIDRYETSLKVSNHFGKDSKSTLVAYGLNFPDALAGSALASTTNSPILLVPKTGDVSAQRNFINQNGIKNINIVGDTGVVSDQVANDLLK